MTKKTLEDEILMSALGRVKGIVRSVPLEDEDRDRVADIEREAERNSLMGLGKVVNAGVWEVLECESVYVALTNMEFDWGCQANLLMRKHGDVVGEEVTDPEKIERLSKESNVWFMHRNFVVYKDKVRFPQDIMKKVCYFEIPAHTAEWAEVDPARAKCREIVYGSPCTPCDVFLKAHYFGGSDEKGCGTILVGTKH